ncbi:Os06g0324150 [Oryza sativa Japonica Group]|uniref:Os06g0324150 protein n=2 Tax=Oryza sativa subsp. japonica TaxID=39947 RepID=C7J3K3_ORYSJ|nr:hypothetical protein EE612_033754 [Oryza sativa]BAH93488.1 Os06g0324150 [Oryza sativa Japonica Group]BAS97516.1 Os06g0324150 [Oryza sativa Japonica Group]|eukprot:NP_001174760.1 Os06g0324150 [Oryza sativa Japonica Group]
MDITCLTREGLHTTMKMNWNMMFFRRVPHQENAVATNNISIWMGTIFIFALFSAFRSDSYTGCYFTWIMLQFIFIVIYAPSVLT